MRSHSESSKMLRSMSGCKSPEQTKQQFLRLSSIFFLLLILPNACAWHQCPQINHKFSAKQCTGNSLRATTSKRSTFTQMKPLPSSLQLKQETSNRSRIDKNVSFTRKIQNKSRTKYIDDFSNTTFRSGRGLFRKLLSPIIAAVILCPRSAMATVIQATAPVTATSIISCPVSAAMEFRLIIRLIMAALIGAALGKERSFAKHSAGVRTMSLVSMGAAVFTICSAYGFANFPKVDASRMAANVASGVGFVGAGVITTSMRSQDERNINIPQNNVVHGLTTAATIWISAAVGVSCGVGLLRVATMAAFVTIFILRMGRKRKNEFPLIDYHTVQQQQQQQRHRSSMLSKGGGDPDVVNYNSYVDDHCDVKAETKFTTQWNEHHDHQPNELEKNSPFLQTNSLDDRSRFTATASQKLQQQVEVEDRKRNQLHCTENHNMTVIDDNLKDQSDLMEDIVRSAWKNSNETVDALVDIVLNRVEQRDRVSKHYSNSREDLHPSSNSEYLP